eukprot:GDKI01029957.1.p2 GENE.GDKI01029957.1~~GDKI01029957.1.p2  ORF type:complete len:111 (+),score=21.92 GDKI01029957.1:54-386(+)
MRGRERKKPTALAGVSVYMLETFEPLSSVDCPIVLCVHTRTLRGGMRTALLFRLMHFLHLLTHHFVSLPVHFGTHSTAVPFTLTAHTQTTLPGSFAFRHTASGAGVCVCF